MPSEIAIGPDKVLDVRQLPCSIKHGLILRTAFQLAVGDHFILQNGRDPVHLREDIATLWPGAFGWDYISILPEAVRVKITKRKAVTEPPEIELHNCDGH